MSIEIEDNHTGQDAENQDVENKDMLEITATKSTEEGEKLEATVLYDGGKDIDEAVEKFGSEVVYNLYTSALVVKAQAVIRRMLVNGDSEDKINEFFESWRPDVKAQTKKNPMAQIKSLASGLSEEEKQKLREELGL